MEEMAKQLEDEVAADLGGERPSRARAEPAGEARQRLKKLMEDDK
jgi:hypothetical protein